MKRREIALGCWIVAIVASFSVAFVTAIYGWFAIFAVASVVWVVWDSKRVGFWRYRTGIAGRPNTVLVLLLLLGWPIVFPWYLGMRLKILAGVASLREEYQPWKMSDATVSPTGLVQPWRGRRL